jgi:excisionase family DNA binding protein
VKPPVRLKKGRRPFKFSALSKGERIAKRLHSKLEVAVAINVSPRTVDNWMAQKRIPFLKLSARLIRFDLERVQAALGRYEIKEIGARQ